jgi:hypothetical protein
MALSSQPKKKKFIDTTLSCQPKIKDHHLLVVVDHLNRTSKNGRTTFDVST